MRRSLGSTVVMLALGCGGGTTPNVDAAAAIDGGVDASTLDAAHPDDAGSDAGNDASNDAGNDAGHCDEDGDHYLTPACGGEDCDDTEGYRPGR